jgi:sporulation protein YlmC with PRC-barrel domain
MRLSRLIGSEVVDMAGRKYGKVHDVLLLQDGRVLSTLGAAFRVHGLQVGPWSLGSRLGITRGEVRGPLPLKLFFRWLHRDARYVEWQDIRSIEEETIRAEAIAEGEGPTEAPGRLMAAGLELLDAQIIDVDGLMAGNVDDLELTFPEEGGPPIVSGILAGPGALAARIGGRIGLWLESVHARLHPKEQPGPARIPFGVVREVGNHVELTVSRSDLEVSRFENWVRDRVISRIPGA